MRSRTAWVVTAIVLAATVLAPGTSRAQTVGTYVPFPVTPGTLLRGDVDLTPRILPGTGFDTYSYLVTRGDLIVLDTVANAVAAILGLPSPSVRGIDIVFTPDASRAVVLTVGHVTFLDVTAVPPIIVGLFANTDTPVSDCDPQIVVVGGTTYCVVPYVGSVRVFEIPAAGVLDLYTLPRTSIAVEAVDPVFIDSTCAVPNMTSVDFFTVQNGTGFATSPIFNVPMRELDMVPVPALGSFYWQLNGAFYRFDAATRALAPPIWPIPGSAVEGCDTAIDPANLAYGFVAACPTTGNLTFFNLAPWVPLGSAPTPGAVVRNFDPLVTPYNLIGIPDGLYYWTVLGTTYAVDLSAIGAPIAIATPGGLTDGVDLAASNTLTLAVLPHPAFADVIDLTTATLLGSIGTPGTLRVDVDAMFPTVPIGPPGSRVVQPYLGGALVVGGLTGAPTQCLVTTVNTTYELDLAVMAVASVFPLGPVAAGVDPVIAQGALSPFDDDPYTVRDRDQDFLCNRAQMQPYYRPPWYLPYWPCRTPWWRNGGPPPTHQFDPWGRMHLEVLSDRRKVAVTDVKGNFITTLTLAAPIVGGAVYDRDWRYCKFYLQGCREAIIDLTPFSLPLFRPQPTVRYVTFPECVYWPPAHDHWNGVEILTTHGGTHLTICSSLTAAVVQDIVLPAPCLYPVAMDYKNKLCSVLLTNRQRCIVDLHPLAVGLPATLSIVPFASEVVWRPVCNTVHDAMNLCAIDLFYDAYVDRWGIYATHALTGMSLWHDYLPYKPYGRIFIEKKSKLCKVPLLGGYEYCVDLAPLAWNAVPYTATVALGLPWSYEPVWDFRNRWEVNVHRPQHITVVDVYRRVLLATLVAPYPIIGPPVIDPINKYLRVRCAGGHSFFVDLWELSRGGSATRDDDYGSELVDDAVFDPNGGYDLAVTAAQQLVVRKSRTGGVVATVDLPGPPARPLNYDPHNRVARYVTRTGQEFLIDMSLVDDTGTGGPIVRSAAMAGIPLAATDTIPPAPAGTAGIGFAATDTRGILRVTGAPGTVEPYAYVALVNETNESIEPTEIQADAAGGFTAYASLADGDQMCVIAADAAGNVNSPVCLPVPPVAVESAPLRFVFEAPKPNPFRRATEIHFALPEGGPVRLEVFDVAGRRVRTLIDQALAAGRHTRSWDGRDDQRQHVAAGVYFLRLQTTDREEIRRVVRMR